ncbi:MAG: DUF2806 domain-containing protein [Methylococcaceae bacterium]|nr:DUF2806 domain-containing protein [Methylococcaceae bacterium]
MTDYPNKFIRAIEPLIGALPSAASLQDSSLEQRASLRMARRDWERQRNIERVVELAAAESPLESNDNPASRDWLNLFFEFAQDIADETAQPFWARLLAAYIANPDTVFKRTLVQLRSMDQWELEAFIEYGSFAFALESGWRFMFEEALTRQEIWGYVRGNDYTQHFINIGLLSAEMSVMRARSSRGMRIAYQERQYELAAPKSADIEASFGYRKFTPTGQQLARAVRAQTYYGYARNLIKALDVERNVQFNLLTTEPVPG